GSRAARATAAAGSLRRRFHLGFGAAALLIQTHDIRGRTDGLERLHLSCAALLPPLPEGITRDAIPTRFRLPRPGLAIARHARRSRAAPRARARCVRRS